MPHYPPSPLNRSSGLPLRAEPEKLMHPDMGAVNISGIFVSSTVSLPVDIINNVASDTRIPTFGGSDNPTTEQLNNDNYPAPERATCVPDTRFQSVRDVLAAMAPTPRKTVRIPATAQHNGFYSKTVTLDWICPVCGGPRGEIFDTISYDGSRRLAVHGWLNPCGHVDYYDNVRDEAASNG